MGVTTLHNGFINTNGYSLDTIIYETENVFSNQLNDTSLFTTITTIYPGAINGEYYMTKGHYHINATDEIYYGIEGCGKIIEESLDGQNISISPLGPGVFLQCDGTKAHRAVNDGDKPFKFVAIGRADTETCYNYNFITKIREES